MAILDIVRYPKSCLKNKCKEIVVDEIKQGHYASLISSMIQTMYRVGGKGLAANQVGIEEMFFVMVCDEDGEYLGILNPEIIEFGGKEIENTEGCLSLPHRYYVVNRHTKVKIKGYNSEGQEINTWFYDGDAFVVQHEMDHLRGIMISDHGKRLPQ